MPRYVMPLTMGALLLLGQVACSSKDNATTADSRSCQPTDARAESPDDLVEKLSGAEESLAEELARAVEANEKMKAEVNALREECFKRRYEGEDYQAQLRQIENRLKALGTLQKYQEDRQAQLGSVREALDAVKTAKTVDALVSESTRADLKPLLAESIVYNESTWDELLKGDGLDASTLANKLSVTYVANPSFNSGQRRFDVKTYLDSLEFNLLNGDDRGDLELLESEEWLKRKLEELPKLENRFQEIPEGSVSDRMILADIRRGVGSIGDLVQNSPIEAITAIAPLKTLAAEIDSPEDRETVLVVLSDVSASIRQWIHLQYKIRCYAEIQTLWRDLDAATSGKLSPTKSELTDFESRLAAVEASCEIVNAGGTNEVHLADVEDDELQSKLKPTHGKLSAWVASLRETTFSLGLRAAGDDPSSNPEAVLAAADRVLRQNSRNRYAQSYARSAFKKLDPSEQSLEALSAMEFGPGLLLVLGFTATEVSGTGVSPAELFLAGAPGKDCRDLGATAADLLAVGALPGQLRVAGFSWAELFEAKVSWEDVEALEPSIETLSDAGVTPQQIRAAGADAADMRRIGASWSQLHAAGFELSAVRSAGATYPELASAGYSVAELRKDGATVNELRSAEISWPVLHEGGYSIKQLFDAGADHTVFTALGVSLRDVFAAGVPVSEYRGSDVDPADLLEAGWTWTDLVSARFAWSDLVVAGITWKAIEEAKLGLSDLRSLGASWSALKELGASGKQLKDAGATFEDLRLCGFGVDACKVLGASTSNLIEAGFAREELSDVDITVQDVIRATVSWPDLQGQGFTIAFLQTLGATWKDLKKIDVPWGELHEAGATWDELREAGATRRDLVALGAPFVLADFAPKTEMKFKPGQSVITATLVAGEPRIVVLEGSFVLVVNEGGEEVSRLRADEVFDSNFDDCSIAVDGGSDVAIASPKSLRVLDLKEGSVRFARQLSNKDGALVAVAISSHSQTVGLITRRSGLQTWNYASNKATGSYTGGSFDYTRDSLALSNTGKLAAFSSGNRIDVVSLEKGEVVARCRDLPNPDITKIRIHGDSQICWVHAGSGKSVYRSSFAAGGASDAVLVVRDESALSEATDLILDKDGEYAVLTPSGLVFGRFDTKQLQVESGSYMAGSLTYSRDQRYLLAYTSSKVSIWTPAGQ